MGQSWDSSHAWVYSPNVQGLLTYMQGVWDYRHLSQAKASIHQASCFLRKEMSSTPRSMQDPWVQINTRLGDRSTSTWGHSLAGGSSPIEHNFYCVTAQSLQVVSCCLFQNTTLLFQVSCVLFLLLYSNLQGLNSPSTPPHLGVLTNWGWALYDHLPQVQTAGFVTL